MLGSAGGIRLQTGGSTTSAWKGPWQSWVWERLALTHLLIRCLSSDGASCPPVQEWFVYSGNPLTHPDLVRPLQMSLPGTDGLGQQVPDCSPSGREQDSPGDTFSRTAHARVAGSVGPRRTSVPHSRGRAACGPVCQLLLGSAQGFRAHYRRTPA